LPLHLKFKWLSQMSTRLNDGNFCRHRSSRIFIRTPPILTGADASRKKCRWISDRRL
jgi:hypothetical protein